MKKEEQEERINALQEQTCCPLFCFGRRGKEPLRRTSSVVRAFGVSLRGRASRETTARKGGRSFCRNGGVLTEKWKGKKEKKRRTSLRVASTLTFLSFSPNASLSLKKKGAERARAFSLRSLLLFELSEKQQLLLLALRERALLSQECSSEEQGRHFCRQKNEKMASNLFGRLLGKVWFTPVSLSLHEGTRECLIHASRASASREKGGKGRLLERGRFSMHCFFFSERRRRRSRAEGGRLEREPRDSLPSLALSRGDTEGSLLDAGAVVIELLVSPGCLLFSIQN